MDTFGNKSVVLEYHNTTPGGYHNGDQFGGFGLQGSSMRGMVPVPILPGAAPIVLHCSSSLGTAWADTVFDPPCRVLSSRFGVLFDVKNEGQVQVIFGEKKVDGESAVKSRAARPGEGSGDKVDLGDSRDNVSLALDGLCCDTVIALSFSETEVLSLDFRRELRPPWKKC